MHLTMIFVDGLGLGSQIDNPVVLAYTPHIDRLLGGHYLWGDREIEHKNCQMYSLDASLGVRGIPQSATGQTALWTGINASQLLGYHLNAYPNDKLKDVISQHSIFKQLAKKGKKVTFANAFTKHFDQMVESGKVMYSASTLCALAGGLALRRSSELITGNAVYQDITNETVRNMGEDVPLVTPFAAGMNLAKVSLEHDFTLYEHFQTDIRGHKRDVEKAVRIIECLDEFLGGYLALAESRGDLLSTGMGNPGDKMALIITSDHGNIEDLSTSTHTLNKVPAICWSNFGLKWPKMQSIVDLTPAVIKLLG